MNYLQILIFAFSATAPIFLVLVVGWVLRRTGLIDDPFVETASRLVFTVALPSLIFVNLVQLDLSHTVDGRQLLYSLIATLVGFFLLWWGSGPLITRGEDRGVFVQGSFRGNLGIIGIALCARLYGAQGLAAGSLLLAVMTLSYNVLSVFALTASQGRSTLPWGQILRSILRNPLILSILAGVTVAAFHWKLPGLLMTSGHYFASMTLPLALVCVGASLSSEAISDGSRITLTAVAMKLVILPALMITGAALLGFRGMPLGTLFAMFAAPTATVSYVMARALGGNAKMAASMVALTTLISPLSLSLGLYFLRLWGLI
ncbi:AEC family transporter [Mangrovitalea sediminis]|uniref:AEC family transporter n=1 Tax=Mangrovitalea sediminis TaxID=1982043 RepID=UPI000BE57580|nr:AEC family transporter [Mangrovitalea sediminis]